LAGLGLDVPLFGVEWGQLMPEKATEPRPLEIVWVALYSVLLLMVMMFSVDVPAR
jgi:hypothetical protein